MVDAELEAAIDLAGRDRVFTLVRAAGWTAGHAVPKFVGWDAVRSVERDRRSHDYSDSVTEKHLARRTNGLVDQRSAGLVEIIFGPGW